MRFGMLGATRAWDADGRPVALGGPGRRAALALLALDAGRVVTVDQLIDGLYGEQPPAGVGNALQARLSRLRGVFRTAGGGDELIERHPAGYRLAVDPGQVDVHCFTQLAERGREALACGDPAAAAELLGEALALWQGPALADVGDAPFAGPRAVRLDERRLAAAEDRIEAVLALGGHRAAVPELRELLAAHPLREHLAVLLLRALHSDGRQAEALAAYAETRDALAEALGADPGPELAAAHLAVLRGELTGGAAGPPRSRVSRETSLPAQLSGLVGRDRELARIAELLRTARLVTVTGPGGAGKTRISVEAAARHPGDSCFTDLSDLAEGSDLAQAVLSALGLRGSGLLGTGSQGPSTLARLTSALAERDLLLVLDNCEHLVADAAVLAADLLAACPRLRVLATSREALGITGEHLLPLPPLPEPAAVQLFTERASAVRPGFDPLRDAAAVAEICRRLDGLPLAVELAAARLRMLSPGQIADRLDDRFRLLTGGSRTARPRQQTLRAVVDWSWELLPEAERGALRRASVFAGGWTLEAAEAVLADPDPLGLIGALVDKSLVVAQEADGEVRYRLLQTVRAYAAERLAESGEETAARQAHLDYFLGLAATAQPQLRGAEQLRWLRLLSAEHDNLNAALRHADTGAALRLIGELAGYWLLRGLRFEGGPYARRVLESLGGPHPPPGLAEEYAICVILAVQLPGGQQELADHLAVAEELVRELRQRPGRLPALFLLWAPFTGVPQDMGEFTVEDGALWRTDPWYSGLMHIGDGFRLLYVDADPQAADREFSAAMDRFRGIGDRWGMIMSLGELAGLSYWRGDHRLSERQSAESLRLAAELGATEDIADLLCNRAERRIGSGSLDAALADCERAAALFREVGAADSVARVRLCEAAVARLRGDLAGARALCEPLVAATPPGWFGGDWLRVSALLELSRIAGAEGEPQAAREYLRRALPRELDARNLPVLAQAAEAVAAVLDLEGRAERAEELRRVARGLRVEGGADGIALVLAEARGGG
ncbi:BTAD domain-containing putative transcriptional regulator [Streptacidiphilus cavernicola]|uniref:BTAD domain-containing putative transcriptional regulator n=1 Tax=Streptacidiphilus cavernicola TaxID=3342716 RepID=A0ABV6VW09_9ACTN